MQSESPRRANGTFWKRQWGGGTGLAGWTGSASDDSGLRTFQRRVCCCLFSSASRLQRNLRLIRTTDEKHFHYECMRCIKEKARQRRQLQAPAAWRCVALQQCCPPTPTTPGLLSIASTVVKTKHTRGRKQCEAKAPSVLALIGGEEATVIDRLWMRTSLGSGLFGEAAVQAPAPLLLNWSPQNLGAPQRHDRVKTTPSEPRIPASAPLSIDYLAPSLRFLVGGFFFYYPIPLHLQIAIGRGCL